MQPKVITPPHCRICVVEVPDGISQLKIYSYTHAGRWLGDANTNGLNAWNVRLPPGNWSILGIWPDEITEERAAEVVDSFVGQVGILRSLLISYGIQVEGKKHLLLIDKK